MKIICIILFALATACGGTEDGRPPPDTIDHAGSTSSEAGTGPSSSAGSGGDAQSSGGSDAVGGHTDAGTSGLAAAGTGGLPDGGSAGSVPAAGTGGNDQAGTGGQDASGGGGSTSLGGSGSAGAGPTNSSGSPCVQTFENEWDCGTCGDRICQVSEHTSGSCQSDCTPMGFNPIVSADAYGRAGQGQNHCVFSQVDPTITLSKGYNAFTVCICYQPLTSQDSAPTGETLAGMCAICPSILGVYRGQCK